MRRRRAIFHDAAAARFSSGQACSQPPVKPSPGHYIIGREQSAAPGYRAQRPLSDGVEVEVGLDEGTACHPWSSAWARLRHFTAQKKLQVADGPGINAAPRHGAPAWPGGRPVAGIHNMSSTWAYSGAWMATPISNRRSKNNTAPSSTPTALRAAAAEPWRHT